MLYIDEESKGGNMATYIEPSPIGQVSNPCEGNWEISEIDHERISYFH